MGGWRGGVLGLASIWMAGAFTAMAQASLDTADGYRGIWYMNQPSKDQYRYKYSGGMATYPQQHVPIAVYASAVNKTFFCYGGVTNDGKELLHMVAYYDHATRTVPRPIVLLNKKTDDAHDNPTIQLDDQGHLWIFSSAHGTSRPSFIHRSVRPYDITAFDRILETNFSYPQPWYVPGKGFLFLHTRYADGRGLFWMSSTDGVEWNAPNPLAKIAMGDYQISWVRDGRVGTAFDYHPRPVGLNARTDIHYLETDDFGASWKTVQGQALTTPVETAKNPALVHDYEAEGLLVYLKDLNFDAAGRPVILYLTSKGYASGPESGPFTWHTARWSGSDWVIRPVTTSDHNYDHGSLYVEEKGVWRLIAPTEPGPQPYGTGGEMVMWRSADQGATWNRVKQLTRNSPRNHTYARRPLHAHPEFYALWADGDAYQPSESCLYFTNREGDHVWRLPSQMAGESAEPEVTW